VESPFEDGLSARMPGHDAHGRQKHEGLAQQSAAEPGEKLKS